MTDDAYYERFLARLTPEQRQQWDAAIDRIAPKYLQLLAAAIEEPCCRPENCPNRPEWTGNVVGWGGNPNAPHACCFCVDD